MDSPSGLERITTLEAEVKELRRVVEELVLSHRTVEGLLLQGRGAVRLVWGVAALAALVVGAGKIDQAKVMGWLKWVGGG